jgi:actin-like protein 6A
MATIYGGGALNSFFGTSAATARSPRPHQRPPQNDNTPPHASKTHPHTHDNTTPTTKTDEVNACVLDVGTHSVKAGYAGDDTPKAVFPSACGVVASESAGADGSGAVKKGGAAAAKKSGDDGDKGEDGGAKKGKKKDGVFVGSDGPTFRRDNMEVCSPFGPDGQVNDWDLAEALWRHALADRLRVTDPADMALLLVEPTHATKASRERCVERLFESLACPAAYLAKAALLACFATAKQTGVVVDAGHMATTGEFRCLFFARVACLCVFFVLSAACPAPQPPPPPLPPPSSLAPPTV